MQHADFCKLVTGLQVDNVVIDLHGNTFARLTNGGTLLFCIKKGKCTLTYHAPDGAEPVTSVIGFDSPDEYTEIAITENGKVYAEPLFG